MEVEKKTHYFGTTVETTDSEEWLVDDKSLWKNGIYNIYKQNTSAENTY